MRSRGLLVGGIALLAVALPAAIRAAPLANPATPAALAVSVANASFKGSPGAQWDMLHPKYKAVVSRARFVACERKAAASVGKVKILGVSAEGTQVIHVSLPLLGTVNVNDVTLAVTFRRGSAKANRISELDSLWVSNNGRWVRIYTPSEYAAYKAGKCP